METNTIYNSPRYVNLGGGTFIMVQLNNNSWESTIPTTDPANTDYAEIMRQVNAGELTIEPADSGE